jgi:hypothetical protein
VIVLVNKSLLRSGNILQNQNSGCKGITSLISLDPVEDKILKACSRKHGNERYIPEIR